MTGQPRLRFALALKILSIVLLGLAYAAITPLYGAPDENAHAVQAAAVVRGQVLMTADDIEPGQDRPTAQVPAYLLGPDINCWRFQPDVPATCAGVGDFHSADIVDHFTDAHNYPPLYYFLVGWPTLFIDSGWAIYAMRLLSVLVFAAGVTVGMLGLDRAFQDGRASSLAALALTPMALFLAGAVNPQSLEIGAAFALAGSLMPVVLNDDRLDRRLIAGGVATIVLCLSRPAAAVWAVLILLMVLLAVPVGRWAAWRTRRSFWAALGLAALGGLVAAGWMWLSQQDGSTDPNARPSTVEALLLSTQTNAVEYFRQLVGVLGWLDVPLSDLWLLAYLMVLLGLWLLAVLAGWGRAAVAVVFGMLMVPATSTLLQMPGVTTFGIIWQGRYSLPLVVGVTVLAAVIVASGHRVTAQRLRVVAGVVVLVVGVAVFANALRRFYIGFHQPFPDVFAALPPVAWLGAGLAVLAFAVGAAVEIIQVRFHPRNPEVTN